ncbi:phosphotransferase family protein [Aerococcaceae bacterium DSM 111022]|nr:phosphotransferase family protein [Aerococcaceae bacterium DSM 111022]
MFSQDPDWEFHPLQGETGDAFMGVRDNERVFFKRNISPFTPTLSAKGIAPKLKWTQRTYSGDILTAQEWHEGHTLERGDMNSNRVIQLIKHVHESENLLETFQKIGGEVKRPVDFINAYFDDLPESLAEHKFFNQVIADLESEIDNDFYDIEYTVCHGDLNHHNFLLNDDDQLFLVDWEQCSISDPMSDITKLLVQYIRGKDWLSWLNRYGTDVTAQEYKRIKWYSQMNALFIIKQYHRENQIHKVNDMILLLRIIHQDDTKYKE